jgi:2-oxoisovalerate dehydrogenase E1 component alpha subunit
LSLVASFEIQYTQFLDPSGSVVQEPLPPFAQDPGALISLYQLMVLTRAFDAKAIALQRTGQLGTYPPSLGQEAVGAGVGCAMRPEDVLVPSYREQAAQLARGVTMTEMLLYWGGDERGSDFKNPREDFPICVPIGSHACHAVGVATAFKLRHQPRVAVCMCGDGATSRGDFYESINLAGVWKLPVVFVVSNNQWAISVPRRAQSAAETLAQKALGAGFAGEQVDGNDVIAVRWALERSLEQARSGGGPTLVEALTYRLHSHTTADDASRYRADAEVSAHWTQDPIARMRRYLNRLGLWGKEDEQQWLHECIERVRSAEEAYLATPPQEPTAMFDYLYQNLPTALVEQRTSLLTEGKDPEPH